MPFDVIEKSIESGQPIELYTFLAPGQIFRYTNHEPDVTVASLVYTAAPISHSEIEHTGEISKSNMKITANPEFDVADLFVIAPPDQVVSVELRSVHRGDLTDVVTLWKGRVLNVTWPRDVVELYCESIFSSLKRPGLRRAYSKMCPHVLYGAACGASQIAFAESVTIDSATGVTVSSADFDAQPDGYFAGGKLEWTSAPGVVQRRGIRTHVGANVTITHPFVGSVIGATMTAFPGCDHTTATCVAKFNNLVNFGGFPYMQPKNPFGQSSVF